MSSSENNEHRDSDSQCPECKKRYISSSQSQEELSQQQSKQRIIIPIRKDLLGSPAPQAPTRNDQFESTLKLLQSQIQNLKNSNLHKDKMIDDLKKQMEHKITHYMIYGEINKQADEINRLKTEISYGSNAQPSRRVNEQHIRQIVKEESRRFAERPTGQFMTNVRENRDKNSFRRKTHSTLDNYSSLRRQFMSPKQQKQSRSKRPILMQFPKEYFSKSTSKPLFNINQAKQKISELQQNIKVYENEMKWMLNFINTFIRSMQDLAYKKYQEQIIIPEWSLKKKAKTSWRYLKHVVNFMYSDPQN